MLNSAIIKTLLPSVKSYIPKIKESLIENFKKKEIENLKSDKDYLAYIIIKKEDNLILHTCIYDDNDKLKEVISTKNIEELIMSILNSI